MKLELETIKLSCRNRQTGVQELFGIILTVLTLAIELLVKCAVTIIPLMLALVFFRAFCQVLALVLDTSKSFVFTMTNAFVKMLAEIGRASCRERV